MGLEKSKKKEDASSLSIGKRARSDSVLENRMDKSFGYKRMKTAASTSQWKELRDIIDKPTTSLCIIEVPKQVSLSITQLYRN